MWTIWLIGAVVCGIIELLTQSVWTLCLSAGCIIALLASMFGLNLPLQLIFLAIGALAMFFIAHKYMKRMRNKAPQKNTSNMDALIGRIGRITNEVKPGLLGRVQIDGDNWQACAQNENETFAMGEQVKVVSYNSIILTVTKI